MIRFSVAMAAMAVESARAVKFFSSANGAAFGIGDVFGLDGVNSGSNMMQSFGGPNFNFFSNSLADAFNANPTSTDEKSTTASKQSSGADIS